MKAGMKKPSKNLLERAVFRSKKCFSTEFQCYIWKSKIKKRCSFVICRDWRCLQRRCDLWCGDVEMRGEVGLDVGRLIKNCALIRLAFVFFALKLAIFLASLLCNSFFNHQICSKLSLAKKHLWWMRWVMKTKRKANERANKKFVAQHESHQQQQAAAVSAENPSSNNQWQPPPKIFVFFFHRLVGAQMMEMELTIAQNQWRTNQQCATTKKGSSSMWSWARAKKINVQLRKFSPKIHQF